MLVLALDVGVGRCIVGNQLSLVGASLTMCGIGTCLPMAFVVVVPHQFMAGSRNLDLLSIGQDALAAFILEDVLTSGALVVLLVTIFQAVCLLLLNSTQGADLMLQQFAAVLAQAVDFSALRARQILSLSATGLALLAVSAIAVGNILIVMLFTGNDVSTHSTSLPMARTIMVPLKDVAGLRQFLNLTAIVLTNMPVRFLIIEPRDRLIVS